jgi:hypothetical protein
MGLCTAPRHFLAKSRRADTVKGMRRAHLLHDAPASTVRWFPAGTHCSDAVPGDLVLVRDKGWIASGIRWAQTLRYHGALKKYAWTNHAMICVSADQIVQMAGHGGILSSLTDYQAENYAVVHIEGSTGDERALTVEFAKSFEGIGYGFFTIAGILLGLVFRSTLVLASGKRWICSAMACVCLFPQGLFIDRSPTTCMPADLARFFNVSEPA